MGRNRVGPLPRNRVVPFKRNQVGPITRNPAITACSLSYSPGGRFATPTFEQSQRWWYQWIIGRLNPRGGRAHEPIGFARHQWTSWSEPGWFSDAEFEATAESFKNPDWTAITLHAYRSRWRKEPADQRHQALKSRLAAVETIRTPTLMIQGDVDRCNPPSESEDQARHFTGPYKRALLKDLRPLGLAKLARSDKYQRSKTQGAARDERAFVAVDGAEQLAHRPRFGD